MIGDSGKGRPAAGDQSQFPPAPLSIFRSPFLSTFLSLAPSHSLPPSLSLPLLRKTQGLV